MIGSQGHPTVWKVPWVPSILAKNSSTNFFYKWINFEMRHLKNVHCFLSKIHLHSLTASWSDASNLLATFSWTSAGPSKYPIVKMIGSQGHLNFTAVPLEQHDIIEMYLQSQFFWNESTSKSSIIKINRAFDKISLLFQTVFELEAKSLLSTVQLEFSWTLEMSDRQNDRFARLSGSLKNSVSTICII